MYDTEKNGHKLYVPVDNTDKNNNDINNSLDPVPEVVSPISSQPSLGATRSSASIADDDTMLLDDTKHKVYIYDLDAELSSSEADDESDTSPSSEKDRLVFLPDIEKHIFQNQNRNRRMLIPPSVFANKEGDLAGHNIKDMQIVLYRESEPSSLTVPRHQDNVRRAILEARARLREKHRQRDSISPVIGEVGAGQEPLAAAISLTNGVNGVDPSTMNGNGFANADSDPVPWLNDVDAMDMD
jgi:hypothetical protein